MNKNICVAGCIFVVASIDMLTHTLESRCLRAQTVSFLCQQEQLGFILTFLEDILRRKRISLGFGLAIDSLHTDSLGLFSVTSLRLRGVDRYSLRVAGQDTVQQWNHEIKVEIQSPT